MRLRLAMAGALFFALALAIGLGTTAQASSAASTAGGASVCVPAESAANAADVHSAAIVITFGDGKPTRKICVLFNEDSISGLDLLQRSGLSLVLGSTGGVGVCAIDETGSTDSADCFKFCKSNPCQYWAYFQWKNNAWQLSPVGSALRVIHDGDTDGWSWGPGNGAAPEGPGSVCPLPTTTPTRTATSQPPTATPTPATVESAPAEEPSEPPASTPRPATPSAATTSLAGPAGSTSEAPTAATDAPPNSASAPNAAASASSVNAVAGAAVTPVASVSAGASSTASPDVPTNTPKAGVAIVEPDAGLRNASTAQRRNGDGFDIVPVAGFGSVVAALAAVGGFMWYRRRQLDA